MIASIKEFLSKFKKMRNYCLLLPCTKTRMYEMQKKNMASLQSKDLINWKMSCKTMEDDDQVKSGIFRSGNSLNQYVTGKEDNLEDDGR